MVNLNQSQLFLIATVASFVTACAGPASSGADSSSQDVGIVDVSQITDTAEPLADIVAEEDAKIPKSEEVSTSEPDSSPVEKDEGSSVEEDTGSSVVPSGPFSAACETTPDCNLPCGSGTCKDGQCQFIPKPGFCVVPAGDGNVSCVEGGSPNSDSECLMCNPGVQGLGWTSIFVATGFEPSQSVEVETQDLSEGGVMWHPSTRRYAKGGHSLYAGVEHSGSYATGAEISTTATLPAFTLPAEGAPFLSFLLWMETEGTPGFDKLRVLAVDEEGSEVLGSDCTTSDDCSDGRLCDGESQKCGLLLDSDSFSSNTQGEWLPFKLDLSGFRGETLKVRFHFGTLDHKINGFEGTYIDDLKISGGCCASNQDCNDGNLCSTGTCPEVGGACVFEEQANCCILEQDCEDDNPCTKNVCAEPGATCEFTPIYGCCLEDNDCDDGDACTQDICTEAGGTCEHQLTCCTTDSDCVSTDSCLTGTCNGDSCEFENTCCSDSFDCVDDDPCTKDVCEPDGSCSHTQKTIFGCCNPTPFAENFDTGNTLPFDFASSDTSVGWQIVQDQQAFNGSSALYYGDPTEMDYDTGTINSGTVTSSVIQLSAGVSYNLKAQLYMDTDFWSDSDIVTFELKPEGVTEFTEPIVVWESTSAFPDDKFAPVEANISAFSGMAVRLIIRFDTVDKWSNYHEGVYVDDISFQSACVAEMCSSNADCKDEVAESTAVCTAGKCTYSLEP